MEELFPDIFSKIETKIQKVQYKHVPAVKEYWKQLTEDLYECRITGRKLTKIAFRMYQDQSKCGPMGFVVEVF